MAVSMRHQLVGFFGSGIQADRVIHIVVHGERVVGVGAIHRTAGGIDQVFHIIVPTTLEDIHETDNVGVDIGMGVLE